MMVDKWLGSIVFVALLAGPGLAQDEGEVDIFAMRDEISALAFDPARFFPSEFVGDASMLRITYTGDDYGWPVWSIAVAEGCLGSERSQPETCRQALRARMVRAPAPPHMTRPRHRGSSLVGNAVNHVKTTGQSASSAMDALGVEWREADLMTCPGARESLARSAEADWVPHAVAHPALGEGELELVMHADYVEVTVEQFARASTYNGWIAPGSPAEWATGFAEVLEPCWRPASVPAPWTRPLEAGEQTDEVGE